MDFRHFLVAPDPASVGSGVTTGNYQVTGDTIGVLVGAPSHTLTLSANFTIATVQNSGELVYTGPGAETITANGANATIFLDNGAHDVVNVLGGSNTVIYGFVPGSGMTVPRRGLKCQHMKRGKSARRAPQSSCG